MAENQKLESVYWTLRMVYGVLPLAAGFDKFTNLLVDWKQYLAPFVVDALPISPAAFMGIVGLIEIVAGLIVLFWYPRFGGYLVAAWLALISVNLIIAGHYDVAVRDVVMAIGAFCYARIVEVRSELATRIEKPVRGPEIVVGAGATP